MKIVADNKIPFVADFFAHQGTLIQKSAATLTRYDLVTADVLLLRTVTRADANLLDKTAVKFVASASAGYDHLDTVWLQQAGITYGYAPGTNADAVAEYVVCCAAYLSKQGLLPAHCRAGIIGVGHTGGAVQKKLMALGFEVATNDPPRAERDSHFHSTPLVQFSTLDLICIHAPLTTYGTFATYHLIDKQFLQRLKPGCILLNAGRGEIINSQALLNTHEIVTCLDVWESEPHVNLALVQKAVIATPHIAGYSQLAKWRATHAIYQHFIRYFQLPNMAPVTPAASSDTSLTIHNAQHATWQDVVLSSYHPHVTSKHMKSQLLTHPSQVADNFSALRRNYQLRSEFSTQIIADKLPHETTNVIKRLGFQSL